MNSHFSAQFSRLYSSLPIMEERKPCHTNIITTISLQICAALNFLLIFSIKDKKNITKSRKETAASTRSHYIVRHDAHHKKVKKKVNICGGVLYHKSNDGRHKYIYKKKLFMLAHRFAFSLSWFFLLRQQRRSGGVVVDAIDGARSPFK